MPETHNVPESLPTAPGGTVSSLPSVPDPQTQTRRIAFPGAQITDKHRFAAVLFRTNTVVGDFRKLFASVIVKSVEVKLLVYKADNAVFATALVPSTATSPGDFNAVRNFPTVRVDVSNSLTATSYTYTFSNGDVPGIEWDLGAEVVRFGHVAILVSHDCEISKSEKTIGLADVQLAVVLELSGSGPGVAVGGTTI
jgi:hypothetical protein